MTLFIDGNTLRHIQTNIIHILYQMWPSETKHNKRIIQMKKSELLTIDNNNESYNAISLK